MVTEIVILAMALLCLILSIILFNGKGLWLIAGYNTATKEEKAKYNEKKLGRSVGCVCFICSIMLFWGAYLGYKVDSGMMSENSMLPFAVIFIVVILSAVISSIIYTNTKGKK